MDKKEIPQNPCRFQFFFLPLHKESCISAKHSSKLGDFALDLHFLCIRKQKT